MGAESRYTQSVAHSHVRVKWTRKALGDVARLYRFLAGVNKQAAVNIVRSFTAAAKRLNEYPHMGEELEEFRPRAVRRVIVGNYEMRYEIQEQRIFILNLWHAKEDR